MAFKGKSVMVSPPTQRPVGFSLFSYIPPVIHVRTLSQVVLVSVVDQLWLRSGRCVCTPGLST